MRVLFICSANKDRSRTAEDHFSLKYPAVLFNSAGTNKKICMQLGTTYFQEDHLVRADMIYVMETKHAKAIEETFGSKYNSKIVVLHIKDIYKYGDTELIDILESKSNLEIRE